MQLEEPRTLQVDESEQLDEQYAPRHHDHQYGSAAP